MNHERKSNRAWWFPLIVIIGTSGQTVPAGIQLPNLLQYSFTVR